MFGKRFSKQHNDAEKGFQISEQHLKLFDQI